MPIDLVCGRRVRQAESLREEAAQVAVGLQAAGAERQRFHAEGSAQPKGRQVAGRRRARVASQGGAGAPGRPGRWRAHCRRCGDAVVCAGEWLRSLLTRSGGVPSTSMHWRGSRGGGGVGVAPSSPPLAGTVRDTDPVPGCCAAVAVGRKALWRVYV